MHTGPDATDVRLVITGHDHEGNGTVVNDQFIGPKPGLAADGWRAYVLWGVDKMPNLPDGGGFSFEKSTPPPGAVRLVQLDVLPGRDQPVLEGDPVELEGIQRPAGDHGGGIHYTSTV